MYTLPISLISFIHDIYEMNTLIREFALIGKPGLVLSKSLDLELKIQTLIEPHPVADSPNPLYFQQTVSQFVHHINGLILHNIYTYLGL